MTDITVIGAGAFGTALAVSLAAEGRAVTLIARNADHAADIDRHRENRARLAGVALPQTLHIGDPNTEIAPIVLLAVPTQKLAGVLTSYGDRLAHHALVACCKGIDLASGQGPTKVITAQIPDAVPAILSGPSFAIDIAQGLPTALTLASVQESDGTALQQALSTRNLRIYRSTDVAGVELGGALKNVIAIAAGVAIGAGLGESARAALITRGFAEMTTLAAAFGARGETLAGLSGLGDLVLTCTSEKSRNFTFGLELGQGKPRDPNRTVEGIVTSKAVSNIAKNKGFDMPITQVVSHLIDEKITVDQAVGALMSRPLKKE